LLFESPRQNIFSSLRSLTNLLERCFLGSFSSGLTYTQTTQLRGAPKKEGRKKGKRGGAEKEKGVPK